MGHRSKNAGRCTRCRLHASRCICRHIEPFVSRHKLVLVMHCRETTKTTATGPLALEMLPHSELYVHGLPEKPLDLSHLHQEGRRVLVLFPSEEARELCTELLNEDPRPVTLIVPDGNWRQATRAAKRVPGVTQAECVTLGAGLPTAWGVRRETREQGLATFEAIARAFGVLEGPLLQRQMEALFSRMVKETLACRGYDKEGRPKPQGDGRGESAEETSAL